MRDEARKRYGLLLVLDYEKGGRNLKLEVSNRFYPNKYEIRDYLGVSMNVMQLDYMFTHKFIALLDRNVLTNRDAFDCWFYMKQRLPLRRSILDLRLPCAFEDYVDKCIDAVGTIGRNRILDGMGDLLEPGLKKWVKSNLVSEFCSLALMYKELQLIENP